MAQGEAREDLGGLEPGSAATTEESAKSWFLVQVKPNSFRIAERNLQRQGFSVFGPQHEEQRRRLGRRQKVRNLLFPGYVFVAFDPAQAPWRSINSTYGVSRLVTFGQEEPRPLPSEIVEGLRLRCSEDGLLTAAASLEKGDRIRLVSGPFANFVTTVEEIDSQNRVWVLLDLLGRSTKVSLKAEQAQKV